MADAPRRSPEDMPVSSCGRALARATVHGDVGERARPAGLDQPVELGAGDEQAAARAGALDPDRLDQSVGDPASDRVLATTRGLGELGRRVQVLAPTGEL